MNTIDNIMALANAYAESYRDALAPNVNALVDEAQTALRTALTEAISKDASLTNEGTKPQTDMPFVPLAKEDAESLLQDVSAHIGVGGYNGATPKQLSERICVEFERLNNKAQTAQPVREPLSNERIAEIVEYLPENSDEQIQDDPAKFIRDLIRAVEHAHNIRGEN